ncbi:acyltransferase [Marinobacter hydrocarbonoclasticus]|nr:acyltransferase [Marinobacter nauticus]
MDRSVSLPEYVRRRNGLPLGASGSLQAMLRRSLGAGSFAQFWRYWNPIWGYYLSRYVMRKLHRHLPFGLSVLLTFAVSGALHDLAVTALRWQITGFFTPWFSCMGLLVILTSGLNLSYRHRPWAVRALFNLTFIVASFVVTSEGLSLLT